ncbi:MAG: NYN domain-containing protein [Candidatus Kariarchaeaceae archaeon]
MEEQQIERSNLIDQVNNIWEKIQELSESQNEACILWDVENVNPGSKSLFVEGLIEFVSNKGRISVAKAFGNWSSRIIPKMSASLSNNGFEMIHVSSPVKKKNSSDIEMITQGMEIALKHPQLTHFYLITGDSDFRSLVTALRRNGKYVFVIYDSKRLNEALLAAADDYIDYRHLLPGGTEDNETEDEVKEKAKPPRITKKVKKKQLNEAFTLLTECLNLMEKEKIPTYPGTVKVRMKVLKPSFDEKKLGFNQWIKFIEKAAEENIIQLEGKKNESHLKLTPDQQRKIAVSSIPYDVLINVLKDMDKNATPKFRQLSKVNLALKNRNFNYRDLGYGQFKEYLLDLQTRNIVEMKVDGLVHWVKRLE